MKDRGITIEANTVVASHPKVSFQSDSNTNLATAFPVYNNTVGSSSQRSLSGINQSVRSGTLVFSNRPSEEIEYLRLYFGLLGGTTAFEYVYPDANGDETDGNTIVAVIHLICSNFSVTYVNPEISTLNATVKQVFIPTYTVDGGSLGIFVNDGSTIVSDPFTTDPLNRVKKS